MGSKWKPVSKSPKHFDGLGKFWCKVRVGSMTPEIKEMVWTGKWTEYYGFVWTRGDWCDVLEWMYLEEKEVE